jgi:hypothetical protein
MSSRSSAFLPAGIMTFGSNVGAVLPLAADAPAVRQLGAESWIAGYRWPVSDVEYNEITESIWGRLAALCASLGADQQHVLLADSGYFAYVTNYLHYRVAVAREPHIVACGPARSLLHPNWRALTAVYDDLEASKFYWSLRSIGKNAVMRRGVFGRRHVADPNLSQWVLGSTHRLMNEYLTSIRTNFTYVYAAQILPRRIRHPSNGTCEAAEAGIELVRRSTDVARLMGAEIDLDRLFGAVRHRMVGIDQRISQARELKFAPACVYSGQLGTSLHRAIAFGLRQRGCRIVGFSHGNDVRHSPLPILGATLYSQCNEFVCPTNGSVPLHEEEYRLSGLSTRFPVVFKSANSRLFRQFRDASFNHRRPASDGSRNVMIIGFPMNANRYAYSPGDFWAMNLDFEIRAAMTLRRAGIRVLYKAHPDRLAEVEGILDSYVDEVVVDPFESTWQMADVYLFPTITTSTFGIALSSAKPVVALDLPGRKWSHHARQLLSKRVKFIEAVLDQNNRIVVDERKLVNAVCEDIAEIDGSFFASYLAPDEG